jgi:hypothetical protein
MIKIYTDQTYLIEKNRGKVFPLLFELIFLKNENLLSLYKIVDSIVECDIVIVPINIIFFYKNSKKKYLKKIILEAKNNNKKIWVYSGGDLGKTISDDQVYVFRLGGFDSKLNNRTYILPSFITDPYIKFVNKEIITLDKTVKPQIGFVGNANGSFKNLIREFLVYLYVQWERISKNNYFDYQSFFPSGYKRFQFLQEIKNDQRIISNFILRSGHTSKALVENEIKDSTTEFYENMYQNAYNFCLRGLGNFSVRFYETLLMGRIPIVVASDMRLPLHEIIDWKKHCVFINGNNISNQLVDFHDNISDKDFKDMQNSNRQLVLDKLSRESFFIQIHKIFKDK